MNLLTTPWLPVVTRNGREIIRPSEIVRSDVLALDFPRSDFNGAVTEFLIGLLSTVAAPRDDGEWLRLYKDRPTVADLDEVFVAIREAFDLGRFMQADIEGEPTPVEQLVPDTEGDCTARNNLDMMNRNGKIGALSPAMAAAALITMQASAPEGGSAANNESGATRVGYYASIRGGGPLTTLVCIGTDLWGAYGPTLRVAPAIR